VKIISGGQTGVDRAALDAGLDLGFEVGGYCPRGRRADDGPIDDKYPLLETQSAAYPPRTRLNVLRSDATLLLRRGPLTPGSRDTAWFCLAEDKKLVEVELEDVTDLGYEYVRSRLNNVNVLNVAGPREANRPGIYKQAYDFLVVLLGEEKPWK
jgi:hypothetical protein